MITPAQSQQSQNSVIWSWVALVRRRWLAGLAVFAAVFAFAAWTVLTARPIYRADARLRIAEPPPSTGVGTAGSAMLGFMRMGGDPFANDMELMKSRSVAESIVRDAALTIRHNAPPGWQRDSLFSSLRTTDQTGRAYFEVTWTDPTQVEIKRLGKPEVAIGKFATGAPVQFGGIEVVFLQRKANGPETIGLSTLPFAEATRLTRTKLKIARVRRDANVVELTYADGDRRLSQSVVESAVNRFVALRTSIQERESGQNVDSLRGVASHTLAELTRAETDLEKMQRESLMVDPGAQSEAFIERYSNVATELEQSRAQLQGIRSVLQRAQSAQNPAERWTKLLAYPPLLANTTIGELLARLTALEEQRAVLAPRRTENNRELAIVLDQIGYIDRSLSALAADIQTSMTEQVQRLESQLANMDAALASVPLRTIELARRQRSARILSEVLVLTEQRLRQEELRQALSFSNVQVIDPPALRDKPVWPRKKLGLAVGWLIAGFCGVLAIALSERADRRVRTAADITRLTGAPVLGVALKFKGNIQLSPQELRAVLHHASANGRGPSRIVLAPIGKVTTNGVAEALRAGFPIPVAAGSDGPEVLQSGTLRDFASASAASGTDVPIALVIEAGQTTEPEVARAVALVKQAGGRIGGTIVLCAGSRSARDVWA
jgi:uncharacterized protein involved in exopolysaccharide biosynthesis